MTNKLNIIKNKAFYVLKNIYNRLLNEKIVVFIFIMILVFIGIQHSVISMYFDDYGNASLSYGKVIENVEGTDYTFSQLLEWAKFIYNNWGRKDLVCCLLYYSFIKKWYNSFYDCPDTSYYGYHIFYI